MCMDTIPCVRKWRRRRRRNKRAVPRGCTVTEGRDATSPLAATRGLLLHYCLPPVLFAASS